MNDFADSAPKAREILRIFNEKSLTLGVRRERKCFTENDPSIKIEFSCKAKKHCGCSNQSGGAQLRIGGAWAPTKRYKVTPLVPDLNDRPSTTERENLGTGYVST